MRTFGRWRLHRLGVDFGRKLVLYGSPIVTAMTKGSICLGHGVVLCSRSEQTALGVARPVILRTLTEGARIIIGDDCGLSGTAICAATSVKVGARCLFGADTMVVDTDFHPVDPCLRGQAPVTESSSKAVTIGDDVFVGARAIILKGVSVGEGAVIGAGSVVTCDVPAFSVVAGNPARVIAPDTRLIVRSEAAICARPQVPS
jgi:acetyltransferase-like isoleucine patch superfamily enzyme